jgi:hypothetical protein
MTGKFGNGDLGKLAAFVDVKGRVQLHQVQVTRLVLGKQDNGRGGAGAFAGAGGIIGKADLAADDGLDARAKGSDGEFKGGEHVVGVGHGDGGHLGRLAQIDKLFDGHCALQKRVFGMDAEVDESGGGGHVKRSNG